MDKRYIEDNEIEIKYLRNQLASEEAEEFEVYLMENPSFLEQLETTSVLMKEVPQVKPEAVTETEKRSLLGSILTMKPLLSGYIAGAMTVVGVIGILSVSEPSVDNNPTFSKVVYLSPTRSVGEGITAFLEVEYPKSSVSENSNDQLVLMVDVGTKPYQEFKWGIRKEAARMNDILTGYVRSGSDGQVGVIVKTRALIGGNYYVVLNNLTSSEELVFGVELVLEN